VVITGVILPVFFVIFLGFLLGRYGRLDVGVFSRAQLYVLSPALVFMAMARAEAGTILILTILLYVVILVGVMLGFVQGIGLILRGDRADRNAMSLAAVFMNSGFYGIPVCLLAFGEIGLIYATTFVVCTSFVQATLGIFLASAGSRGISEALVNVFKVPLIYAIITARVLAHFSLLPPEPFMKMINLLGQAAIPIGLLLLGMQLDRIVAGLRESRAIGVGTAVSSGPGVVGGGDCRDIDAPVPPSPLGRMEIAGGLIAALLRIVGGFGAALVILNFFDFEPVLKSVMIVESSMPTAVAAVVYATEFDCRPRLVTIGILCSTLLSVASVAIVLSYVG
jgi:predicted permease